jgi:O-antigen/teichoic acid export membrane protein
VNTVLSGPAGLRRARRRVRAVAALFATNASGTVLGQIALLLAIPIQLRSLGVESFGLLALFNTCVLAHSLTDAGVNTATLRFVARTQNHPALLQHVVSSALTALVALSVAVVATAWGLALALGSEPVADRLAPSTFVLCVALALTGSMLAAFAMNLLKGLRRYRLFAGVETLNRVMLPVVATLAAVLTGEIADTLKLTTAWLLAAALGTLGLVSACTGLRLRPTLRFGFFWRRMSGFCRWTWVQSAAAYLGAQIDRFVVAASMNLTMLAAYSVAASLANALVAGASAGGSFLLPEAAVRANDRAWLRKTFHHATFVFSAGAAACIVVATLAAPAFLSFWTGVAMAGQVLPVLLVLLWVAGNAVTSAPANHLMNAMGRTRLAAICSIAGNLAVAGCVLAGGLLAGLPGVLAGKLSAVGIGLLIRAQVARRVFDEPHPLRTSLRLLWPTVGGTLVLLPLSWAWLVR